MGSKGPPPPRYIFDADFCTTSPPHFLNGGPHLLSENENQSLLDFSTNAGRFASELRRGFQTERALRPESHQQPLSPSTFPNTRDDLQAASTLFSNSQAQASHSNLRSYSMPTIQRGLFILNSVPLSLTTEGFHSMPMVPTPHGMIHEQLAALIPNNSENGSIDEQLAAQFSHVHVELDRQRPSLKRAYTYGTDSAFKPTGYAAPAPNIDEAIHQRLVRDWRTAQPLVRAANGETPPSPTGHFVFLPADSVMDDSDNDQQSSSGPSGDERRSTKKRRKAKRLPVKDERSSGIRRKSTSTAPHEGSGRKKYLPSAGKKCQRENLTEEQKRNNHILSEQKRRSLIRCGFDDLYDLIPEICNGGLRKSAVLMEAANFLDRIISDNSQYLGRIESTDG